MSSLYHKSAQMLLNWSGEDACRRTSAADIGRQIVDMVINEIREHGMPSLEQAAAPPISDPLDALLEGVNLRRAG